MTFGVSMTPLWRARPGWGIPLRPRSASGLPAGHVGLSLLVFCVSGSPFDDDPVFRSLARRTLLAEGLNVVGEADSVAAAVARFPTRHKEEKRLSRQQTAERLIDIAYALTAGGRLELSAAGRRVIPVANELRLECQLKSKGHQIELELGSPGRPRRAEPAACAGAAA
jgi:hypothetical protein